MSERATRALESLGADPWRAFLHVDGNARGDEGPLAGLVVSVKDNLAVRGQRMTCGSRHLEEYVAPYDATVVERLRSAGAILLGKTNMDEFAAGSSGENSAFGPTLNPRDLTRVPGGSSSGAGASVASGVCDVGIGSDTGGSIRCPAAFCGVAGFKPTHAMVSRFGLADLCMSLEGPAPLARDVATLRRVLRVIAGPDPRDAITARAPAWLDVDVPLEGARLGVPREFFHGVAPDVERAVRAALARFEAKGAQLIDVSLPSLPHALASYYVLNYAEFASAMMRYDGVRYGTRGDDARGYFESAALARAGFGAEVKRRILLGTFVTSREERGRWYDAARRARAKVMHEVDAALAEADVLVGPTMPMRAFALGERSHDPRAMYAADILTVSANLAGGPAGSLPLRVDGLPIGLQVMGPRWADAEVLSLMERMEEAL